MTPAAPPVLEAMGIFEAGLVLMVACIGFALIARRANMPYAVVLVLGGMALAFLPGRPSITLDPEFALAFFLPPLLQGSAYRTDWRAFRANLAPIMLLAVGAVLWTAFCIACLLRWLVPEMPWPIALAFGAIVAPPDAVAAAAVLSRLPVPRRIAIVLEGESLLNDASALVLYRFAIAAAIGGTAGVSVVGAGAQFLLIALGGAVLGWLCGRGAVWVILRLSDALLVTAFTFLAGFGVYLLAEAAHVSGVIAVVALGIIIGRAQHSALSASARIQSRAVWGFVEFILTGLVFLLVGLHLNGILDRIQNRGIGNLLLLAGAVSAVLILSRFAWLYASGVVTALLRRWLPRHCQRVPPAGGSLLVMGWAGMRGVVSLAAALALPLEVQDRDLLIFLAFSAILVTLVLQGTTLEWVIRRLGLAGRRRPGMAAEEATVRRVVSAAQLAALQTRAGDPLDGAIAADLVPEYRDIHRVFAGVAGGASGAELTARLQIRLQALRAGREALLAHHRGSLLPDELLDALAQEMDLEEVRLRRLLEASG